ncbi:S-layer homology domain-containing protein [Nodularia harveyana UHCC-0300]|uniref:S-layer homology domain-containing protein n=1 Tax=Nodularia harveyana UHCC-0300 TaxID=2974287 RepID=A0ABU5UEE8_9CYAN|nr:S-layer homology domain-containing protein [Nodularia harveyana]MEA5581905.1 S-layer homology domain-containing protein [Nodularia harveyana UHCC-0300]
MFNLNRWQSGTATLMAVSVTVGTVAPFIGATPSLAQTRFSDVSSNYWAAQFIDQLSQRGVIAGFPDGSFRPEEPVTRAQFASMLDSAFSKQAERQGINFVDVPSNFWASNAIRQSYTKGFLSGYPGNRFEPNQAIPRQQVLVSLANGLDYSPTANTQTTLQTFSDSFNIADWARSPIAAATEKRIVVNYPNVSFLNPTGTATRAQVAAFIYQALVSSNQASAIVSPYIVALQPTGAISVTIPQGTAIPIKYDQAEKILVTKDETAPLTLTVDQNVVTQEGTVVIPAGSRVVGKLQPAQGGSQFVADKLVLTTGEEYPINASSEVITKTETIRKGTSTNTILRNTVLGGGAAAAVSAVTGDRAVATEEVLGGAVIGGLFGLFFGRDRVELISIEPNTDLQMTINQQFLVSVK